MFTAKCKVTGCGKEFSASTQEKADRKLQGHIAGGHAKRTPGEDKPKRPYTRKKQIEEVTVNFCCNCGADIHKMAVGMALASKIKG